MNQTRSFLLYHSLYWLTETDRRDDMIPHQFVMVTPARAAHPLLALLACIHSVLLVSLVAHVTQNRGRFFVYRGLVVQVKVGLEIINETYNLITAELANDL